MKGYRKKVYPEHSRRVLVAMSGGVDSSVAAALLKKAGYDVAGAFLRCYETEGCGAVEDLNMARLAAAKIGIPFYVFDFRKEYKNKVIDYFVQEYKSGRTPNPDIMCNKHIKFGLFLKKALSLGFNYIATGHYVRKSEILNPKSETNSKSQIPKHKLLKGVDTNKDQSYFLWTLTQDQLKHCLFPIGDYTKPEVRAMARKFGLPNAARPDSQGICFVGKVRLVDFLGKYLSRKPGKIIDKKGRVLGTHQGAHYFTIGQRQGLGMSGGPYFVLETDVRKNLVTVTKKESDLCHKEISLSSVNWISGKEPELPFAANVKIRYRHKGATAKIYKIPAFAKASAGKAKYKIFFNRPQRAIAPGQSAVFYKGNGVLGGGIIK